MRPRTIIGRLRTAELIATTVHVDLLGQPGERAERQHCGRGRLRARRLTIEQTSPVRRRLLPSADARNTRRRRAGQAAIVAAGLTVLFVLAGLVVLVLIVELFPWIGRALPKE
jgi:hypothetical protein